MSNWLFLPPYAGWALAVAALVLAALTFARWWRERRVTPWRRQTLAVILRCLALFTLLIIALNPTGIRSRDQEGKRKLIVLLDTSYSMATRDVNGQSRMEAALQQLQANGLSSLREAFDLDTRIFAERTEPADFTGLTNESAQGRGSDISAAVTQAAAELGDAPEQAGVLLISDGRPTTTGAMEAARLALARSVPLWTWTLGGPVPRRDLWLETPTAELLAFAGAEIELNATLRQVGLDNQSFTVELLRGDEPVDRVEATPGPDGAAPVRFVVQAADAGEQRYQFRVTADPGEADAQNNEQSVFVRVVGQKVRVLLAEGQPHWETKFLVQSLKNSERVDLTAIYRLGPGRQFTVLSAAGEQRRETGDLFPRTAEQFSQYDVIIFGRGCESFFDDNTESHLTEFVSRHGGALVFSRGKSYSGRFAPLAKFEPVVWGAGATPNVRLSPTTVMADSPMMELARSGDLDALFDHLPRFDVIQQTSGVKPLAVVLAGGQSPVAVEDQTEPIVLAYQLYGQGRVVTINAGGLWRWSFREKSEELDEQVYDRFWRSLLRWLLSGSDFLAGHDTALRSDRRRYTDEQPVRLLVRTRGLDEEAYRPKLQIEGPMGLTQLEPRSQGGGTYLAEAGALPAGSYKVRLVNNIGRPEQLDLTLDVVSGSIENRVLSADPDLMRRLAEVSQGSVIGGENLSRLGSMVQRWDAERRLADARHPLWNQPWWLAVLVLLLGAEWLVRRREGLL